MQQLDFCKVRRFTFVKQLLHQKYYLCHYTADSQEYYPGL